MLMSIFPPNRLYGTYTGVGYGGCISNSNLIISIMNFTFGFARDVILVEGLRWLRLNMSTSL